MDEDIKAILSELAHAINDELEKSKRIGASVGKLEDLGYKFALYLEATILLTKKDATTRKGRKTSKRLRTGSLKLSDKDLKFLKSLKIALHEKNG